MFISKSPFAKVSLKLAAGNGVPAAQVCLGPGRQPWWVTSVSLGDPVSAASAIWKAEIWNVSPSWDPVFVLRLECPFVSRVKSNHPSKLISRNRRLITSRFKAFGNILEKYITEISFFFVFVFSQFKMKIFSLISLSFSLPFFLSLFENLRWWVMGKRLSSVGCLKCVHLKINSPSDFQLKFGCLEPDLCQ